MLAFLGMAVVPRPTAKDRDAHAGGRARLDRGRLDRAELLDASERLLDRLGWDGLTMTGVAAEVGVKVPSLYNHVEGLDALRRDLGARAWMQLGDELRAAVLGRSGEAGFRTLTDVYRSYANRYPGRYEAITRAAPDDDSVREAALHAGAALHAVLQSFGLHDPELGFAEVALWASIHGFVSLEIRGALPQGVDVDAVYDDLVGGLVQLIEARVAAEVPQHSIP